MLDLIESQVLTEKSIKLLENNKYSFNVSKNFTKKTIKVLIEEVFDVKVLSVNTYILSGKQRRLGKFIGYKKSLKRALVTLSPGKVIPFFSGL